MSYDYSENILVQESTGHLLADELGWQVELAYNQEVLGENGEVGIVTDIELEKGYEIFVKIE